MKVKHSEKREIMRSQINLNPYNPKHHSTEDIKKQARNIRENGYLGGVVWNETTGNLLDGHRRVLAFDIINKYDGENDYPILLEVTHMDEKTELEQMTYMAVGNTKADYKLIAEYANAIDDKWFTEADQRYINELAKVNEKTEIQDLSQIFFETREAERKEPPVNDVYERKQRIHDGMESHVNNMEIHALVRFADEEQQRIFCEAIGVVQTNNMIIEASQILEMLS